jgi:hypothetical protein
MTASHRARQLRDRGRFRFAREAARPRSLSPSCASRRALPSMQWPWSTAYRSAGVASVDLKRTLNAAHLLLLSHAAFSHRLRCLAARRARTDDWSWRRWAGLNLRCGLYAAVLGEPTLALRRNGRLLIHWSGLHGLAVEVRQGAMEAGPDEEWVQERQDAPEFGRCSDLCRP